MLIIFKINYLNNSIGELFLIIKLWDPEAAIIPGESLQYTDLKDIDTTDSFVSITGTWFSESNLAFPVNSSSIECFKEYNTCFESEGIISDRYLYASNRLYTITSWNEREIIAKQQYQSSYSSKKL